MLGEQITGDGYTPGQFAMHAFTSLDEREKRGKEGKWPHIACNLLRKECLIGSVYRKQFIFGCLEASCSKSSIFK